jgi:6-phosphogluconolactonase (cycloisomerase 2 family)
MFDDEYKSLFPGQEVKVVYEFDIAWVGWECDSKGMVVEDAAGTRHLILTNHGQPYVACFEELTQKINEYRALIAKAEFAQQLMGILI